MATPPSWKRLLRKALVCIDALSSRTTVPAWSFGGGTAMMLTYRHRLSQDIDIFFPDPQVLGYLTPRLNDDIQEITDCTAYDEQHASLKLILDIGEIDFIAGLPLTQTPFERWQFEGRTIQRETPVEIVAKKVVYRGHEFRVRDVFDLACLLERDPVAVGKEQAVFVKKRDLLLPQLRRMRNTFKSQIKELVKVSSGYETLRDNALERVIQFYENSP
ncbi:MAG: nucleotidyl transferase AbiEii/AbiGii toxin family protein [Gammaproteobacteria bacterium]|nr:nucleotidyl transferase AbiEii/AbiGii toxin family protein [Gammaproteobacteria bacterium]